MRTVGQLSRHGHATWLALLVVICLARACLCDECDQLVQCSPSIAALDYSSLNTTFDISCRFSYRVEDVTDLMWRFQLGREELLALNMDGQVLAPFEHYLTHHDDAGQSYSISTLRVKLLSTKYYTNYTISLISNGCRRTVHIHLKERALGYSNTAATNERRSRSRTSVSLLVALACSLGLTSTLTRR